MNPALLVNRKFDISFENPFYKNEGRITWFSSLKLLQSFKSVKRVDFYNTTSSSGEWDGYIIQKLNNRNYLIMFSQTSPYAFARGYEIYTGEAPILSWDGEIDREEIEKFIAEYLEDLY